jgi:nucleotide-binding universal stress UspA family protein
MFHRILVPVDLTGRHRRTVDLAASMARAAGGRVDLLHVVEVIPGMSLEDDHDFYKRLETRALDEMGRLRKTLDAGDVTFGAAVSYGRRVEEILGWVERHDSDLIVLTSHKVALDKEGEGWGTLSYQLGILAPCSVLLVK